MSRVGEAQDGEPEVHEPQGLWSARGISLSDPVVPANQAREDGMQRRGARG